MKTPINIRWNSIFRTAVSALAGLVMAAAAHATEVGPLIDVLVSKKILSPEDAEKLRADLSKKNSKTAGGKLKLFSDSNSEVKFYGDLRLRYQNDQTKTASPNISTLSSSGASPTDAEAGSNPATNQRSRERYRLRFGVDIKASDTVFGGFGLATGPNADSNMQTFTGGFDNYNIYINKAYISWKPNDWFTIYGGKYDNPIYTTDLVWDPDITPQGISQIVDFTPNNEKFKAQLITNELFFFDNDEFRTGNLGKDVWLFAGQLKTSYKINSDVTLTFAPGFTWFSGGSLTGLQNTRALSGATFPNYNPPVQTQKIVTTTRLTSVSYDAKGVPTLTTTPLNNTLATTVTTPASGNNRKVGVYTNGNQKQVKVVGNAKKGLPGYPVAPKLANQTFVTSSASATGTVDITSPQPTQLHNESNNLAYITLPGDVSFKAFGQKAKLYWDFAWNFAGEKRFNDVLGLDRPEVIATQDPNNPLNATSHHINEQHYNWKDSLAFLAGLQLGENKKKGDWSVLLNYRQVGVASVDPNLNDSDVFQSALNMRGPRAVLTYNLSDNITLGTSYSHGSQLRDLRDPLLQGVADLKAVDVFQVDLNWKF